MTSAEHPQNGASCAMVSAYRNLPAGEGWGWRVEAGKRPLAQARGELQYRGTHAEATGEVVAGARQSTGTRVGVRGSAGVVEGIPFASRPIGTGSFALVEVEGLANVPVLLSQQGVTQTDARGWALVTGLAPWQKNTIAIDPTDLPMDADLPEVERDVTPHARGGQVVRFPLKRTRQALIVLVTASGQPVPAGARVQWQGRDYIVARRGELWSDDLQAGDHLLEARWPGGACVARVNVPVAAQAGPENLGPFTCNAEGGV